MSTAITSRPIPEGYQLEWDNTIWNVGHVFRWSEFYRQYMVERFRITVRPGETLPEAWQREYDSPMGLDYEIFFRKE